VTLPLLHLEPPQTLCLCEEGFHEA
jgi:hypothetical protein